jgi:two-component system response regulator NreC
MITIVIAEDHQSLIDGIMLSLEKEHDIRVVGFANDGEVLLDIVRDKKPTLVITDIRMPKMDGINATTLLKKEFPEIFFIAFSMFDQKEAILQMKQAGASGYIMKNASLTELVETIRKVASGQECFDENISLNDSTQQDNQTLSKREKEILKLIGEGKTSLEIADVLFISKNTVDTHRKNILHKLGIHGKSELLRFALERKYDFNE